MGLILGIGGALILTGIIATTYIESKNALSGGLDSGSTFDSGIKDVTDSLTRDGYMVKDALGNLVGWAKSAGEDISDATSTAVKQVKSIFSAKETTDSSGKKTTELKPEALQSGVKFNDFVTGSLPYFGMGFNFKETSDKIVKDTREKIFSKYIDVFKSDPELYDAANDTIRAYMDENGLTYVDGKILNMLAATFVDLGIFEQAGYHQTKIPLNQTISLKALPKDTATAYFKSTLSAYYPRQNTLNKALKAVDLVVDDINKNITTDFSSLWFIMRFDSFGSMEFIVINNSLYKFSLYLDEYMNQYNLSNQKVATCTFRDSSDINISSMIYKYDIKGEDISGDDDPSFSRSNYYSKAYTISGGYYNFDTNMTKEEGYAGVTTVGTLPDTSKPIKFAERASEYTDNTYSGLKTKAIAQPDTDDDYLLYPWTMPLYTPTGLLDSSSASQSVAQAGAVANPDTDQRIKDLIAAIPGIIAGTTPSQIPAQQPQTPTGSDTGKLPAVIPPSSGVPSIGLAGMYNPTQSQLVSFSKFLWSQDFLDQFKKLMNNPMDCVISLHLVYVSPSTGGSDTIQCGYLSSGVTAKVITNQYKTIDCGHIKINKYFNNILDYAPYTRILCFLPFIGMIELDANDIMDSNLTIAYRVDVLTGACLAQIAVARSDYNAVIATYSGNCAVELPLTGNNSTLTSFVGVGASVLTGVAGGAALAGTYGAVAGGAIGALQGAAGNGFNIQKTGSISANAAAMGQKKPFLIITRPKNANENDYNSFYGFPSTKTITLGGCSGFTKVKSIHLSSNKATENELAEIENILKNGVIV